MKHRTPYLSSMSRRILKPLWFVLALLFLFEVWLWDLVQPPIRRLVAVVPWETTKAAVARGITALPPVIVLFIFIVPHVIALPLEVMSLWFVAQGMIVSGIAVYGLSKGISLGFTLLLFEVSKPKLMELAWFRWSYAQVIRAREWAHQQVKPIRDEIVRLRHLLRLRVEAVFGQGHFLAMLRRVRALVRRTKGAR